MRYVNDFVRFLRGYEMLTITSEQLFYGGIVGMASAVFLAVLCVVLFVISGKRLRKRLEEEYGKLE